MGSKAGNGVDEGEYRCFWRDVGEYHVCGTECGGICCVCSGVVLFQRSKGEEEGELLHTLVMILNFFPAQPKTPEETQEQFNEG